MAWDDTWETLTTAALDDVWGFQSVNKYKTDVDLCQSQLNVVSGSNCFSLGKEPATTGYTFTTTSFVDSANTQFLYLYHTDISLLSIKVSVKIGLAGTFTFKGNFGGEYSAEQTTTSTTFEPKEFTLDVSALSAGWHTFTFAGKINATINTGTIYSASGYFS